MISDLQNWMIQHGFASINDFRGRMRQASSGDPMAFERVQFMKIQVGIE
jgi:dihydroorotate dehydrogenase (fumarate)